MRVSRVLEGAVLGFVAGAWIAGGLTWLGAVAPVPFPTAMGNPDTSLAPRVDPLSLNWALLFVLAGLIGAHLGTFLSLIYGWHKAPVGARARLGWTVVLPATVILLTVAAAANDVAFGSLGDSTRRWYEGFAVTVALSGYVGHWLATGRAKPGWGRIALYVCLGAAAYSLANLTVFRGPG